MAMVQLVSVGAKWILCSVFSSGDKGSEEPYEASGQRN